jgi:hypothetical protein
MEPPRKQLHQRPASVQVPIHAPTPGKLLRLSVTSVTLYSGGSSVNFMVSGIRFRKDGTLGKLQETLNLSFTDERQTQ